MKTEAKGAGTYVAGGHVVLHAKIRLSALVLAVVSAVSAFAVVLLALGLELVLVYANQGSVAAVCGLLLDGAVGHETASLVGPEDVFDRERDNLVRRCDEGEGRGDQKEDGDHCRGSSVIVTVV